MRYEYWNTGILLIIGFLFLMIVPCVSVAIIGYRMLTKLGTYPSKTPEIQMSICLKLFLIEAFSFGLIYIFYTICWVKKE